MCFIHRNYQGIEGLYFCDEAFTENDEYDFVQWGKANGSMQYSTSFHPKITQLLGVGIGARMMPDMCPLSQLFIRSYRQGESLYNHFDGDGFGEIVFGISLGTACVIKFEPDISRGATGVAQRVFLPRRSLYIMSRCAMFNWTHGIESVGEGVIPPPWNPANERWSFTIRALTHEYVTWLWQRIQSLSGGDSYRKQLLQTRLYNLENGARTGYRVYIDAFAEEDMARAIDLSKSAFADEDLTRAIDLSKSDVQEDRQLKDALARSLEDEQIQEALALSEASYGSSKRHRITGRKILYHKNWSSSSSSSSGRAIIVVDDSDDEVQIIEQPRKIWKKSSSSSSSSSSSGGQIISLVDDSDDDVQIVS